MNGRAYDPDLGRMLSADPMVQFPGSGQSSNRYSYVLNNPGAYTDPSGSCIASGPNCPSGLAGGIRGGVPQGHSGVALRAIPVVRLSLSLSLWSGPGTRGGSGTGVGGCVFGTNQCGNVGISFTGEGPSGLWTTLSWGGTNGVTLGYQYQVVFSATTNSPNQSHGEVTKFLLGDNFEKYAAAAGPLLAQAGHPNVVPLGSDVCSAAGFHCEVQPPVFGLEKPIASDIRVIGGTSLGDRARDIPNVLPWLFSFDTKQETVYEQEVRLHPQVKISRAIVTYRGEFFGTVEYDRVLTGKYVEVPTGPLRPRELDPLDTEDIKKSLRLSFGGGFDGMLDWSSELGYPIPDTDIIRTTAKP